MEKFLDPTSTKNTKEQDSHATLDKRATNSLGVTFYRRWSFWGTYKYYLNCLRWVLYTTIFRIIFIAIATFLCNLISCSVMQVLLITSMTFVWCILLKIALCIMVIDYFAHNKSHFPDFKTRHVTQTKLAVARK